MAHVMSLIFFPMSIGFMSHVDFKKRPCHPVEFRGQGPHHRSKKADSKNETQMYLNSVSSLPRVGGTHQLAALPRARLWTPLWAGRRGTSTGRKTSVEMPGFEPGASYMRSKRSTTELHPHLYEPQSFRCCTILIDHCQWILI